MKLLAALILVATVSLANAADLPASSAQSVPFEADPPIPHCLKVFAIARDMAKWKSQITYSEMNKNITSRPVIDDEDADIRPIIGSIAPRLYNDPLIKDLDPQETGVVLYKECKTQHPEDPSP